MADSRVIEGTDIVAVDYPGRLDDAAMAEVGELVRSVSDESGSATLLVEFADADPDVVDPDAFWGEAQRLSSVDGVRKCAVITDAAVVDALPAARGEQGSAALDVFAAEQRDEALFWLRE